MSDATAKRPHHSTNTSAQTAPTPRRSASNATTARLRFAVVGYGYWGPQLVRNLDRIPNAEVARIVDLSAERRQKARLEFPNTQVVGRFEEALESDVDAVVIATPIRTHFKLAKQALEQGKHVLPETSIAVISSAAMTANRARCKGRSERRATRLLTTGEFPSSVVRLLPTLPRAQAQVRVLAAEGRAPKGPLAPTTICSWGTLKPSHSYLPR
jgi:predicted dinucleotide-utilizing enzyme